MTIISLDNVSKSFHGIPVLTDATFSAEAGRAYGFVGANGSGKSVLFRLICGFTVPDRGTVWVDPRYMSRGRTFPDGFGVTIDGPAYLPFETGFENLRRLAAIRRRIDARKMRSTMRSVGLEPDARQNVRRYSLGMKQKLSLAQALMEDPDVLVLDEPFNGLDTESTATIRRILAAHTAAGGTLLFTSHNRDDIDDLADEVLALDGGRITRKGTSARPVPGDSPERPVP